MKPNQMARSAADEAEAQATQLDHLINEHQRGSTSQPTTPEATLLDQLVQLATTTKPAPEFVAQLEQQLQHQFRQQEHTQGRAHQQSTTWLTTLSQLTMQLFPRRRFAFALAALLLFCMLLLTIPVRATLWDWLYGFGLLEETQVSGRTIPVEKPAHPNDAPAPLTLQEIRQQAPFTFRLPTALPAGLQFTGGFVMPTATETSVTLAYHTTEEPAVGYPLDAPLLFLAISDGALPNRPLVVEGYQQAVLIGQTVGIYTHGNWQSTTPSSATEDQTGPLFWNSSADAAWLIWQADGLNYLLYAQGLGLTTESMVQIAASME